MIGEGSTLSKAPSPYSCYEPSDSVFCDGHSIAHSIEQISADFLKVDYSSHYSALHRLVRRGGVATTGETRRVIVG